MSDAPKRGRGRPRSVDRDAAIQAAMDHYWRAGPDAVSVNALCRRIGISKPAMYREFGDEAGLLLESLARYRAEILVPRQAALSAEVPFPELLERALIALTSDLGTPPGCLLARLRMTPGERDPRVAARVAALADEQLATFEAWYQGALDRGEANPTLPADQAARYLDTWFSTILMQMTLGQPVHRIREYADLAARILMTPS